MDIVTYMFAVKKAKKLIRQMNGGIVVVHAKGNPMTDGWKGVSDKTYAEIIDALTIDGDPLDVAIVGKLILGGSGAKTNVYCLFELDPEGATYPQEREAYGADKIQGVLMSIDTTLETVEFYIINDKMSEGVLFQIDANGDVSGV